MNRGGGDRTGGGVVVIYFRLPVRETRTHFVQRPAACSQFLGIKGLGKQFDETYVSLIFFLWDEIHLIWYPTPKKNMKAKSS